MKKYQAGGLTAEESSLSSWAGPYVTEMLGRGAGVSGLGYTPYMGAISAGYSPLQQQAFTGLGALQTPTATTAGSFTAPGMAQQYMNPYINAALQPQMDEARRQAQIEQQNLQSRYSKAGAYGGGRQAVADVELSNALQRNLANIYGTGMQQAYDKAANLFGQERGYGLQALQAQQQAGGVQRDIEQQGIAADIAQFEEERDYPFKQIQYMQSLLQGLPLQTQSYTYNEPSGLQSLYGGLSDVFGIYDLINTNGSAGGAQPQLSSRQAKINAYLTLGYSQADAEANADADLMAGK